MSPAGAQILARTAANENEDKKGNNGLLVGALIIFVIIVIVSVAATAASAYLNKNNKPFTMTTGSANNGLHPAPGAPTIVSAGAPNNLLRPH